MEYFINIFNDILCAYQKKYCYKHVLLKVIDSWKALDEICLLIAKFKACGLTNEACEFMSSYWSGRYQKVRLKNVPLKVFHRDLDWGLLSLIFL